MAAFFINGKFCLQRTTGVQRYAREILLCLDEQCGSAEAPVLLVPAGATVPALRRIRVETLGWPGMPLHVWEQVLLPWKARAGLLLNLAGSAPAFAARRLATFHDAAVFDFPGAYTPLFRSWYRWLFKRVSRRDPALLTVSRFSRDRLVAALRVREEQVFVVPGSGDHFRGILPDSRVLARHGLQSGRYWLCVATRNPTKRLELLRSAWLQHATPPDRLPLVLVGGSNPSVFDDQAASRPAERAVIRAGVVSDAELKALLSGATALVVPSIYEGFGLPVLEAMVCGCPVIAARAAALPEVAGEAALWVRPDDVDALAAALVELANDQALRVRLTEAGRARAHQFRWQDSAEQLIRHLDRAG